MLFAPPRCPVLPFDIHWDDGFRCDFTDLDVKDDFAVRTKFSATVGEIVVVEGVGCLDGLKGKLLSVGKMGLYSHLEGLARAHESHDKSERTGVSSTIVASRQDISYNAHTKSVSLP